MKIQFEPNFLTCQEYWTPKMRGVVLVQKKEHIDLLWKALCEQDDYWESYKNLIQVAPEMVTSNNIQLMCEDCGKTDIYDVQKLKDKMWNEFGIEFILYQTNYWD